MNWEAIGAIGEIVGALAVVGSLVYLASQIRVSNIAARAAKTQDIQNQFSNWYKAIYSDDEIWSIWVKGSNDDPEISVSELGRYRIILLDLMLILARVEEQRQSAEIDDWALTAMLSGRRQIVSSSGFKRFWKIRKNYFPEAFCNVIEDEIKLKATYYPGGIGEDDT